MEGMRRRETPSWWGIQDNPEFFFAYGQGEGVQERGAYASAQSNALAEAARTMEVQVDNMMKDFYQEAGVENPEVLSLVETVTRAVASQTVRGAHITMRESFDLPTGRVRAFVRYSIPKASLNQKNVVEHIRNEEALYNEFKATQAFQNLDKQLGN